MHAPHLPPPATLRRLLGYAIVVLGLFAMLQSLWRMLQADSPQPVFDAFLAGAMAAAATALGTLPVWLSPRLTDRVLDGLFGFGAGVMLAAVSFSLIGPGLAAAAADGAGRWEAGTIVGVGVLLGAAVLLLAERLVPHEHFIKGVERERAQTLRRSWLFVFAIVLHNVPEGLAIGVAYAGDGAANAEALATGIAIQDIPEGMVVAVALIAAGYRRGFAIVVGMLSGLVEPAAAALAAAVVGVSQALLPWGLAFAAGAMLFVVSHEIIPESHRKGHEAAATGGLMLGFVLMLLLDTALA
ncbi:ZIP family metal transporter [Luteimonas sp. RD2P54]|uniref:ZIP family metal transporter n=1 Tax=Luteimonas endophytica TaxID=3042023 RepID=A0ABT6J3U4_9GAMM|nr:ZIP family metal transporter [Luteimonas endophytica]MDH5821493.1 ZIP family metal transporter [Luteimonas endophytica]